MKFNINVDSVIDKNILIQNLSYVCRLKLVPKYISFIMEEFDKLCDYYDEEDPASPAHWRDQFLSHLEVYAQQTFNVTEASISVGFGSKSFLGYDEEPDPRDDTPLLWFVYYLEGFAGEYGFIDEHTFYQKKSDADISKYGRFGKGFMVSKDRYFKEGWHLIKPWEEAVIPNSPPNDIFEIALERLDISPDDFKEAIVASLEGKLLG